jgi:hypothetical protein
MEPMTLRTRVGQIAVLVIVAGAVALVGLMGWSVWKLHTFTTLFWIYAWIFTVLCFLIRSQTRPLPGLWNNVFAWWGVAFAIAIAGAKILSPVLNSWLKSATN